MRSDTELAELRLALEEVRDGLLPHVSNRAIDLVLVAHLGDERKPALHDLIAEMLRTEAEPGDS